MIFKINDLYDKGRWLLKFRKREFFYRYVNKFQRFVINRAPIKEFVTTKHVKTIYKFDRQIVVNQLTCHIPVSYINEFIYSCNIYLSWKNLNIKNINY